ncbi:MAG: hypothetical protein VX899_00770 [Myxococcota bacterium]|nr:hypothetical protein [Myxococcota bacterium]
MTLLLLSFIACTEETPDQTAGLAVLGTADADAPESVQMRVILTADDGLDVPRDLEFNPEVAGELWVVNFADDSVTVANDAGTDSQVSEHLIDPYALHFMEKVSSISFGAPGTFGTCQESRNTYNDRYEPNDFMGPALWSSDRAVFAESNPEAVDYLSELYNSPVDLGSHLDMQHETPLCTGIAWETDNVYWTVDGLNGSIDRVDFGEDHGPGYDDHSDGITAEYVAGEIGYVEDVSSHMVLDSESGWLYLTDPANQRILRLDITTGTRGADLPIMEPGTDHYQVDDAVLEVFVDSDRGLGQPSGLALVDGVLFVTDHATGWIFAYETETGDFLDGLDTGRGSGAIQGLRAPTIDELWVVDSAANEVFLITPKEG